MILNNISAAIIAQSHEHHFVCLNNIQFQLTRSEMMSINKRKEYRVILPRSTVNRNGLPQNVLVPDLIAFRLEQPRHARHR